ncbi:MAG: hypothetical protein HY361_00560 [Candidatus Aenigmarchaeota archaeon]|nr:hypothetical protein [Candidatus Aenigmarchaeota archaeon]
MESLLKQIINQNEVVVALLGRMVFPENELKNIIMKKKKKPEDYIRAYNLCDGEHSLTEIAAAIKVSTGTLSPILAYWKSIGIVYEINETGRRVYKNLYSLKEPKQIEIEDAKISGESEQTSDKQQAETPQNSNTP